MGLKEALQLFVTSYLLQPLGCLEKCAAIIRVNDSRASSSGYEAFETGQERTSLQVGNQL